jgi:hypothetical protein
MPHLMAVIHVEDDQQQDGDISFHGEQEQHEFDLNINPFEQQHEIEQMISKFHISTPFYLLF